VNECSIFLKLIKVDDVLYTIKTSCNPHFTIVATNPHLDVYEYIHDNDFTGRKLVVSAEELFSTFDENMQENRAEVYHYSEGCLAIICITEHHKNRKEILEFTLLKKPIGDLELLKLRINKMQDIIDKNNFLI